ncbi:MAG TPA: DUF3303 family protein [Candidatus Acidoferrales bacterium]|nr:DUF3303 family protein [Candidatus Acidoferrales bacterium]
MLPALTRARSPQDAIATQSNKAEGALEVIDSDRQKQLGGEFMRFLLKVNIPVESGNAAAKAGKLGATIQSILADLKPEAVYFTDSNGQRAGYIFLDMQDAAQIPALAEPWFLAFNASIEIHPVMTPDDLGRAGGAIENAVKKYGYGG